MILMIDIGNTNVTFGCHDGTRTRFTARMATDRTRTADQYGAEMLQILSLNRTNINDIGDAAISSVVPELTEVLARAAKKITKKEPLVVGPGVKCGLNIKIDNPAQLGADLVCSAVGAAEKYPLPCLILDLGTATKISVLDADGAFLGCSISPGVVISMRALTSGTSLLPSLYFDRPQTAIGTNTVKSMQAGIVLGSAAMLDGMCAKIEKELGRSVSSVVATGGVAERIIPYCDREIIHDPDLIFDGMMSIYKRNRTNRKDKHDDQ
ncbi:MAG: type III pantothenate kinase [Clostridia bacterium]|nr:type III pantothenate kinase [Clostridia bacterium]